MKSELEHCSVPAICDWLRETSDLEIPVGQSREDALRRARELLAMLATRGDIPAQLELDDDFRDVLWASVEELDQRPRCQATFKECDHFYQSVAALATDDDPFQECDEVLHRTAQIGWRSAPGGLEDLVEARARIYEHGDADQHRSICATADQLPAQIQAISLGQYSVSEVRDLCAGLMKAIGLRPRHASACLVALEDALAGNRIGHLDDTEHSRGVASLAAGTVARLLCDWDDVSRKLDAAAARFNRCAARSDIERVNVERINLEFAKGNFHRVCTSAPSLLSALTIPRERVKTQLIHGWALLNLGQCRAACDVLSIARASPTIDSEPALRASVLTVLGNSLDHLNRDADAMAAFKEADSILARFNHPQQLAFLTGAMGEFLNRRGRVQEAALLYEGSRQMYRESGQGRWVGYMGLLIAELLVQIGRTKEAERELGAAIPLLKRAGVWIESAAGEALLRDLLTKRGGQVRRIRDLRDQLGKQWQ